ncbi:hypothetical protein SteCoe_19183 [Stentor coeruleus]|uniref:Uncharacterized protein n=1 Tax=Stentor coeruleus TaxID=5963 RepID=A0A1R2BV19_9CILI|nr:hypothetical protein SteCoe_19183 [Stentor coeruleus]
MNSFVNTTEQKEITLGRWTPETPKLERKVHKPNTKIIISSISSGLIRTPQQLHRDYDYLSKTRLLDKRVIKLPVISLSFNCKRNLIRNINKELEDRQDDTIQAKKIRSRETGNLYKFTSIGNATLSFFNKNEGLGMRKSLPGNKKINLKL